MVENADGLILIKTTENGCLFLLLMKLFGNHERTIKVCANTDIIKEMLARSGGSYNNKKNSC